MALPASQFDSLFAKAESDYELPPGLLKSLAIQESGLNANAKNPDPKSTASGIMQINNPTARAWGVADPFNPEQSIFAAGKKLRERYNRLQDWSDAVAAHHLGDKGVDDFISIGALPDGVTRQGLGSYVNKIMGRAGGTQQTAQPAQPVAAQPAKPNGEAGPFMDPTHPPKLAPPNFNLQLPNIPKTGASSPATGADIGVDAAGNLYVNGVNIDSKDYGKAIQAYREGLFTTPGKGQLPPGYRQPAPGEVEAYFEHIVPSSATGKSFIGTTAGYRAGWHDILGAGKSVIGVPDDQNTSRSRAAALRNYADQLGAINPLPQTWDQAQGAGGVAGYAWDKLLQTIPYMAEAVSTGLVGAGIRHAATGSARLAASLAGRQVADAAMRSGATVEMAQAAADRAIKETFKASVPFGMRNAPGIAMVLGTYPSAVGDILGNQQEQAGQYGVPSAVALGAPYAALNLIGGGRQAVRALTGETLHGAINAGRGVGGRLARAGTVGAVTAAEESVAETGQEVLNQAGRMAVDPRASLTSPEAIARYRESAIAGGTVGLLTGGVSGAATRANQPRDLLNVGPEQVTPPPGESPYVEPVVPSGSLETSAQPLVPPGGVDLRPDAGSAWQALPKLPLQVEPGIENTMGEVDLVSGTVPRRGPEQPAGEPSVVMPTTSGLETNQIGERFPTPPVADIRQLNAGPAPGVEGVTAQVRPTGGTASVLRQRVPQFKLRPAEESTGVATPTTAEAEVGVTVPRTRGEALKERARLLTVNNEIELTPGRKPTAPVIDTAKKTREQRIRERAAAREAEKAAKQPAESEYEATVPVMITQQMKVDLRAQGMTDAEIAKLTPQQAHDALSKEEAVEDLSGFTVAAHAAPTKPTTRERARAASAPDKAEALSEEMATNTKLTEAIQTYEGAKQDIHGFSRHVQRVKQSAAERGTKQTARATSTGGVDRIKSALRQRAIGRENLIAEFKKLVKKYGVAGVDAAFAYRKKNNLETAAGGEESNVMIRMSNLWRMYRDGHFARDTYGLTSPKEGAVRDRYEEGGKPTTILEWFKGKHKDLNGRPIAGVRAVAYYLRHNGRTDLEAILGGRLYHIFKDTDADYDLKVVEEPIVVDNRTLYGAFVAAGTEVKHGNKSFTTTKPTLIFNASHLTEEILLHELVHAGTVRAILADAGLRDRFLPLVSAITKAKLPKEASERLKGVIKLITEAESKDLQVAELVAYGYTNNEFQQFLKGISMSPPRGGRIGFAISNAFEFFVNMVKFAVGAHGIKYNAMQRFIEEGGRLFDAAGETKATATITVGANSIFKAAAFREKTTGEVIEAGTWHDPKALKGNALDDFEAGFISHTGQFYTRDEALVRLNEAGYVSDEEREAREETAPAGEIHSSDVFGAEYQQWKEGQEYEGRLFGGSYDYSVWRGLAKDAPKHKMMEQARERYNTIRSDFGLPEVTDWSKRPEQLIQRIPEPIKGVFGAEKTPEYITKLKEMLTTPMGAHESGFGVGWIKAIPVTLKLFAEVPELTNALVDQMQYYARIEAMPRKANEHNDRFMDFLEEEGFIENKGRLGDATYGYVTTPMERAARKFMGKLRTAAIENDKQWDMVKGSIRELLVISSDELNALSPGMEFDVVEPEQLTAQGMHRAAAETISHIGHTLASKILENKPPAQPTVFAAEAIPTDHQVPHGKILNPVTAVEKMFKTAFQTLGPWWREDSQGTSTFEKWAERHGGRLRKYIVNNHPTISRFLSNVVDKFAVPTEFRALLDMGRKVIHNAGQYAFELWTNIGAFPPEVQELLHQYLKSGGKMDLASVPEDHHAVFKKYDEGLKNIMERAGNAGMLPAGLEKANITEVVRWIEERTAKLAFGLKSSGVSKRPKGEQQGAHKDTVLGVADGYHRGTVTPADGSDSYHVFVPTDATLAAVEKKYGQKIALETDAVWRDVTKDKSKTTHQMWSAFTYRDGLKRQNAADFSDALVTTVHRILHDTAVAEFANGVLAANEKHLDPETALVFKDRGALAKQVGAEKIIDKLDNPVNKELSRTPGYWVLLGNGYGNLSKHYVPATVYAAITDAHSAEALLPGYREVLNFWKKTKTAWSVPTHFNNVASSFIMAYMNDIPLSSIVEAARIYARVHTWTGQRRINLGSADPDARLWDEFSKSGALIASYATGEFGIELQKKLNALVAKTHKMDNASALFRWLHAWEQSKASMLTDAVKATGDWGVKMYEAEDNIFRMAAYLEALRRQRHAGEDVNYEKAGKFAADAMINYSIDAKYINVLRKTVMPFLAWPYRMVPMLIRTALFKPWKLATMWGVINALNALAYAVTGDDEDEERQALPEYMRGNLAFMFPTPKAIRMPWSVDDKPVFWNIANFMPLGDMMNESKTGIFGVPWPQGMMPGGPLITATEVAFGHNVFLNKPLHQPTDTMFEKVRDSLKFAWNAFSPNIPLPLNRGGEKVYDLWREKHGITGSELDWGTNMLQMVGPKMVAIDVAERQTLQAREMVRISKDFRAGISRLARDEMRYANPDYEKIQDKQAQLIEEMMKRIAKVKGEEE